MKKNLLTDTSDLWVASVAGAALAHIIAGRVGAQRVLAARARHAAFVHVHAASGGVGGVVGPALLAHAERFRSFCAAKGMRTAAHTLAWL